MKLLVTSSGLQGPLKLLPVSYPGTASEGRGVLQGGFQFALTLKLVSSAAAPGKMLIRQSSLRPFPSVRSVIPTVSFTAPQGVSSCLKGWHRDSQNHLLQKKNKYAEHSSFSCVGGVEGRNVSQNPNKQMVSHSKGYCAA